MAFLLGLVLSIMGSTLIGSLIIMIISKLVDFKFMYFRFLFWNISSVNDEIKLTTRPFTLICQCMMVKPGLTDKEDKLNSIINYTTNLALVTAISFIVFANRPELYSLDTEIPYSILLGFAVGIFASAIVKFIYMLYFLSTKNKGLAQYNKQITQNWISGHPLESLNIPPLENLNVKGSLSNMQVYQCFRYLQRLYLKDNDSLASIVCWFESNLSPTILKSETGCYYNIIFYYSYIRFNYEKAVYYYNKIYDELINDMDSNGRRTLAYYQFYVLKNPVLAKSTAINGLNVINKFSVCKEERDNEAKLLNNLIYSIDTYMPY